MIMNQVLFLLNYGQIFLI